MKSLDLPFVFLAAIAAGPCIALFGCGGRASAGESGATAVDSGSGSAEGVSAAPPTDCNVTYVGSRPPTFWVGVRDAEGVALTVRDVTVRRVEHNRSRTSPSGCGCRTGLPFDGDACYGGWVGGGGMEPYRGILEIELPGKPPTEVGFEMPAIPCGQRAYVRVRLDADGVPSVEWAGPRTMCQ